MTANILTKEERRFWRPLITAWRQDLEDMRDGSYVIPHETIQLTNRIKPTGETLAKRIRDALLANGGDINRAARRLKTNKLTVKYHADKLRSEGLL